MWQIYLLYDESRVEEGLSPFYFNGKKLTSPMLYDLWRSIGERNFLHAYEPLSKDTILSLSLRYSDYMWEKWEFIDKEGITWTITSHTLDKILKENKGKLPMKGKFRIRLAGTAAILDFIEIEE